MPEDADLSDAAAASASALIAVAAAGCVAEVASVRLSCVGRDLLRDADVVEVGGDDVDDDEGSDRPGATLASSLHAS